MRKAPVLVFVISLLFVVQAAFAQVTTVFSDDFESYADNAALTSAWGSNTMGIGLYDGPSTFTLGNKSIANAAVDTSTENLLNASAGLNLSSQDTITVTFDLYDPGPAATNGALSFGRGAYGFTCLGIYNSNYAVRLMDNGPGWVTLDARSTGWQKFQFVMASDSSWNTVTTVYHNNVLVYTSPSYVLAAAAQGTYGNWIRFGSPNAACGAAVYYDNFLVQTGVPLPPRDNGGPYAGLIRVSNPQPAVGDGMTINYVLPFDATSSVTVQILDSSDTPVAAFDGPNRGGPQSVVWDGTVDNAGGADVPVGVDYKVQISVYNNTAPGWYEATHASSQANYDGFADTSVCNIFTDFSPNIARAQTKQDSDIFGMIYVPSCYAGTNATAAMIRLRGDLQPVSGDGFADRVLRQPTEPDGNYAIWGSSILPGTDTFFMCGQADSALYYTKGDAADTNAVDATGGYTILYYPRSTAVVDEDGQLWAYIAGASSVIDKVHIGSDGVATTDSINVMAPSTLDGVSLYSKDVKFDSDGNLYWVSRDSKLYRFGAADVKAIKLSGDGPLTTDTVQWNISLDAGLACQRTMGVGISNGKVYLDAIDSSAPTDFVVYEVGDVTNASLTKTLTSGDIVYEAGKRITDGITCALSEDAVGNFVVNNRGSETISLLTPGGESLITTLAPSSQTFQILSGPPATVKDWRVY